MNDIMSAISNSNPAQRDIIQKILSEYLITIADCAFKSREIHIAGYRFVNCRFDDCRIFVSRGTFEFINCYFGSNMRYFSDDAQKLIQFYTLNAPQLMAHKDFAAKIYPNGTFSIARGVSIG